jgi:predicted kinase
MTKQDFLKQFKIEDPTLILMQGLPGSGKSTLAKEIIEEFKKTQDHLAWGPVICSADDYWIQPDGSYKFDKEKVPDNHYACMRKFCRSVALCNPIIVDNTNTTYEEMLPYIQFGKAYGLKIVVILCDISVRISFRRNTHNVPLTTIENMDFRLLHSNIHLKKDVKDYFVVDTK